MSCAWQMEQTREKHHADVAETSAQLCAAFHSKLAAALPPDPSAFNLVHASSAAHDATRDFESKLPSLIAQSMGVPVDHFKAPKPTCSDFDHRGRSAAQPCPRCGWRPAEYPVGRFHDEVEVTSQAQRLAARPFPGLSAWLPSMGVKVP